MSDRDHPSKPAGSADQVLAVGRRDAARALGISERLLWSWTNQGRIPHVRIGHRVLYPRADLERWLSEQSAKGGRR